MVPHDFSFRTDGGAARHVPVLGVPALEFLNVRDGVDISNGGNARFGRNINLRLTDTQNFNIASGSLEISGGLSGSGNLVKTGAGQLRFTGDFSEGSITGNRPPWAT